MTMTTIQHVTTICSFQNGVMRRKVSYFKALSGDDVYNFHGGFGVLDIWNILVGGREIFFFLLPLGGWSVSSGLEDGLLFSRSAANVSTQQSHFSYWSKGFYGHVSFICCVVGVCEAEVWRLHHSGHPQPSRTIGGRWVQSGSPRSP